MMLIVFPLIDVVRQSHGESDPATNSRPGCSAGSAAGLGCRGASATPRRLVVCSCRACGSKTQTGDTWDFRSSSAFRLLAQHLFTAPWSARESPWERIKRRAHVGKIPDTVAPPNPSQPRNAVENISGLKIDIHYCECLPTTPSCGR